jgi:hypothetical protein
MNSSIGGDSITRNEFSMDPTKHIFASGMSGMDKSTLLVNLFIEHIRQGNGVFSLTLMETPPTRSQIYQLPFAKDVFSNCPTQITFNLSGKDTKAIQDNWNEEQLLFSGDTEEKIFGLNRATIDGLIVALGDDSALWTGQVLTAEMEKVRVAGKAVTAVYLAPEGYERMDYENGYTVIVKKDTQVGAPEEVPSVDF